MYRAAKTVRPAPRTDARPSNARKTVRYAAALSLTAASIHLWAAPEHLGEWWGYGTFFLATALGQGLYGVALLLRGLGRPRPLLLLGLVGNLAIVVLYVVTRTVGVPLLGPHAGEAEGVAPLDLAATTSELVLIVALGALTRDRELLGGRLGTAVLGLVLVFFAYAILHDDSHQDSQPHHHADHHAALYSESPGRSKPFGTPTLGLTGTAPWTVGVRYRFNAAFVGGQGEDGGRA